MPNVKLVVLYPQPADPQEFERAFFEEHVPMAMPRFGDYVTHVVLTKPVSQPGTAQPQYHRISELHFSSMEHLQEWLGSAAAQEAIADAARISTGGPPLALIATEDVVQIAAARAGAQT